VTAYIMFMQKLNRDDSLEYLFHPLLSSLSLFSLLSSIVLFFLTFKRFVRKRRSRILPNHGFYKQLGDWETALSNNVATL
jgi:hypothetical protein